MYITSKKLAENLNIKTNYLFKLMRRYGYSQVTYFDKKSLIVFKNSLVTNHYKSKLMKSKLDNIILSMRG